MLLNATKNEVRQADLTYQKASSFHPLEEVKHRIRDLFSTCEILKLGLDYVEGKQFIVYKLLVANLLLTRVLSMPI